MWTFLCIDTDLCARHKAHNKIVAFQCVQIITDAHMHTHTHTHVPTHTQEAVLVSAELTIIKSLHTLHHHIEPDLS